MVVDKRIEKISIQLPARLEGRVTVYNQLGESAAWTSVDLGNGYTKVNDLALQGGKVIILKFEK